MAAKNQESGWLGWVGFASFMLLLGGFLSGLAGFVALFKDTLVYVSETNNAWILSYTQWGWIHIVLGLMAVWAASSLLMGRMYGRIIAVLVALASAAANMMFIPIYPIWSIMVILIDIFVIYAVVVHADELRVAN